MYSSAPSSHPADMCRNYVRGKRRLPPHQPWKAASREVRPRHGGHNHHLDLIFSHVLCAAQSACAQVVAAAHAAESKVDHLCREAARVLVAGRQQHVAWRGCRGKKIKVQG